MQLDTAPYPPCPHIPIHADTHISSNVLHIDAKRIAQNFPKLPNFPRNYPNFQNFKSSAKMTKFLQIQAASVSFRMHPHARMLPHTREHAWPPQLSHLPHHPHTHTPTCSRQAQEAANSQEPASSQQAASTAEASASSQSVVGDTDQETDGKEVTTTSACREKTNSH